jgi:hypothetical protein
MFSGCDAFNRDLSRWDTRLLLDAEGMFEYAFSFNQDLCAWGDKMSSTSIVYGMFFDTACPLDNDPEFTPLRKGPFCRDCPSSRPKLPSITQGPITLPLVPAAVSNLPDGRILAWAGEREYQSHGEVNPAGTFTSIFDPVSGNSSLLRVESKLKHVQRSNCPQTVALRTRCSLPLCSNAVTFAASVGSTIFVRHGTLRAGGLESLASEFHLPANSTCLPLILS